MEKLLKFLNMHVSETIIPNNVNTLCYCATKLPSILLFASHTESCWTRNYVGTVSATLRQKWRHGQIEWQK